MAGTLRYGIRPNLYDCNTIVLGLLPTQSESLRVVEFKGLSFNGAGEIF